MKRIIIRSLWAIFILGWLAIALAFTAIYNGWIGYLPPIEDLQNPIDKYASQLISSEGDVLGSYAFSGGNRVYTPYKDISPYVVNALIATEDERFHEHSGIDFKSLGRVLVKTVILQQRSSGGGSTISQQLAKQLYSKPTKNFLQRALQKPIEWVIAAKIERYYSKEEILALYLNQFDFLYNAVGINSAAHTYFGKKASTLNIQEAAMLVGMCKNPSYYNPIQRRNSDKPINRRNVVFGQMEKAGFISSSERDSLSKLPIEIKFHSSNFKAGKATYFREYIRKVMMAKEPKRKHYASWQGEEYRIDSISWATNPLYGWCNKNQKSNGDNYNIYSDGLKIYTTLSSQMQEYAEEAVKEHLSQTLQPAFDREKSRSRNAPFAYDISKKERWRIIYRAMRQSERWRVLKKEGLSKEEILKSFRTPTEMQLFSWKGMIDTVLTPKDSIIYTKSLLRTGFMAMNPNNGHVLAYVGGIDFSNFQYDMVMQGRRQVGSTIKPFLYSLAMVDGLLPCDSVLHSQPEILLEDGNVWRPRNANKKRIDEMVSIQWGLQHSDNWVTAKLMERSSPHTFLRLLRSYGLKSDIFPTPAMCLGTSTATVAEMVSAYTTFLNNGIRVNPLLVVRIEDQMGNTISEFKPQKTEVLSKDASQKMIYMLQNVVKGGTAQRLRYLYKLDMPLGGKTGTTQQNSDAWFMGFSPDIVAGCWVGGEDMSVRFRSMRYGQGAASALPIFALFMKKVYANTELGYSKETKFNLPEDYSPCNNSPELGIGSEFIQEDFNTDHLIDDGEPENDNILDSINE